MRAFIYLYNIERACWQTVDLPDQIPEDLQDDELLVEVGRSSDQQMVLNPKLAIHTFTAAKLTIQFWESTLGHRIRWRWNRNPPGIPLRLKIDDHYEGAVFFFHEARIYFGRHGKDNVCKAFDVVAHEITHAVLRSVYPKLTSSDEDEDLALIEALCDLTPIFVLVSTKNIRTYLNAVAPLFRRLSPLSEFAEGFGSDSLGLRSALHCGNGLSISDLRDQYVHNVYNELTTNQEYWDQPQKLFTALMTSPPFRAE